MPILYSKNMSSTFSNNGKINHNAISYNYDGSDLNIETDNNGNINNYELNNNELMDLLAIRPSRDTLSNRIKGLMPVASGPKKRKGTRRGKKKYKKMTKRRR